jgi:hypothetical protein
VSAARRRARLALFDEQGVVAGFERQ